MWVRLIASADISAFPADWSGEESEWKMKVSHQIAWARYSALRSSDTFGLSLAEGLSARSISCRRVMMGSRWKGVVYIRHDDLAECGTGV